MLTVSYWANCPPELTSSHMFLQEFSRCKMVIKSNTNLICNLIELFILFYFFILSLKSSQPL
jgi:hypothetical protein